MQFKNQVKIFAFPELHIADFFLNCVFTLNIKNQKTNRIRSGGHIMSCSNGLVYDIFASINMR